jgi:Cohesin domain
MSFIFVAQTKSTGRVLLAHTDSSQQFHNQTCMQTSSRRRCAKMYGSLLFLFYALFLPLSTLAQQTKPNVHHDWLDGVNTLDLMVIAKHITGKQVLPTPYKIIAADVNKSHTITAFDIVALRKLILGIYTELPHNTVWRFVDAKHVFPSSQNPFESVFPEFPMTTANGDVAKSAAATDNKPSERPIAALAWSTTPAEKPVKGYPVTIPVQYDGAAAIEALQFALRYDPARLRLISPSVGALEDMGLSNFGLTDSTNGIIRFSWFATPPHGAMIQPGDVLFYLTFEVRTEWPESTNFPMELDAMAMPAAAWTPAAVEYAITHHSDAETRLQSAPTPPTLSWSARCLPNPVGNEPLRIEVNSDTDSRARLLLFSAFGTPVFRREVLLSKGMQAFEVPEFAALPEGVYMWEVLRPGEKISGRIVKVSGLR